MSRHDDDVIITKDSPYQRDNAFVVISWSEVEARQVNDFRATRRQLKKLLVNNTCKKIHKEYVKEVLFIFQLFEMNVSLDLTVRIWL